MSSELEKALERRRQKKEGAQSLAEQQRAAQETVEQERIDRINADFERVVTPVLQRFWSENVTQELVELFDEYAKQVAQRVGPKEKKVRLQRKLDLIDPSWSLSDIYDEKERLLKILNTKGWEDLELRARYGIDGSLGDGVPHFGFSVTSKNPSSVHWWTGGGYTDCKISGEYLRTPESLEKTAECLAEALERGFYDYVSEPTHGW